MGECARADYHSELRPPVPPIYLALCKAQNRGAALRRIFPLWPERPLMSGIDLHYLVEYGEIRFAPICEAYPPVEGPLEPEEA